MKAKRISQKAVKNMINGNTALLHIGNFDTGKRTNLKRAVSECVYTSRLYYTPTPPLQPTVKWIEANRHDNTTYFADYKGGTVSIVEVNTGN